jgi:hypothetical protein
MKASKNITLIAAALAACIFAVAPLRAQKVGSTSMQFLHVMPCARGTAMGDAYSVIASGAEAVYWNPSGVALARGNEFSSTYIDWIFDAQQGTLSYATTIGDIGAIGLQVQYVDYGEFEETSNDLPYIKNPDEPGMTGQTFHPFSYLVGATYARSLTDRFSVGLTAKYAHESLFNGQSVLAQVSQGVYENVQTWAGVMLFDFGVRYDAGFHTVQLAAAVQNFGSNVTYAKESNPVPLLFRFGIAGDLLGKDALLVEREGQRLTVAFDLFQPNDYAQQAHLGLEYEFADAFALRAGYKFNYDNESFTFGVGFKQTLGSTRFSLDYSYGSVGTLLGAVQRITLGAGI